MTNQALPSPLIRRQLKPSMEALGLVLAFLTRDKPFSEYRAGKLVRAVKYQLSSSNHVCLLADDVLIAYAGWLPITVELGEKWLRNEANLVPVPAGESDAFALTTVSVASPESLLPLIRACRDRYPNRRVFFRRDSEAGRSRKATVHSR